MTERRTNAPTPEATQEGRRGCAPIPSGAPAPDAQAPTLLLDSTLTCPGCGATTKVRMPVDACQFFWDCPACGALLKPKPGDCCVFCSYGDAPCPPVQLQQGCGN